MKEEVGEEEEVESAAAAAAAAPAAVPTAKAVVPGQEAPVGVGGGGAGAAAITMPPQQQEASAVAVEAGGEIVHRQHLGMRQCKGRQCRTVCHLFGGRRSRHAGGGGQHAEGASPMSDLPAAQQEVHPELEGGETQPQMGGVSACIARVFLPVCWSSSRARAGSLPLEPVCLRHCSHTACCHTPPARRPALFQELCRCRPVSDGAGTTLASTYQLSAPTLLCPQASVVDHAPSPAIPAEPEPAEAAGSTRGSMEETPEFPLVIAARTSRSAHHMLPPVPEGDGSEAV